MGRGWKCGNGWVVGGVGMGGRRENKAGVVIPHTTAKLSLVTVVLAYHLEHTIRVGLR